MISTLLSTALKIMFLNRLCYCCLWYYEISSKNISIELGMSPSRWWRKNTNQTVASFWLAIALAAIFLGHGARDAVRQTYRLLFSSVRGQTGVQPLRKKDSDGCWIGTVYDKCYRTLDRMNYWEVARYCFNERWLASRTEQTKTLHR